MDKILDILNKFSYNSIVILSYFFICFVALLLNKFSIGGFNKVFACRPGSIFNPMNYIRLITSGICHKDWKHFRNNFTIILLIGPMLEYKYGSINMIKMLLITTVVSSIFHIVIYRNGCIGASDNVYMLIVLCSLVNMQNKIPITLILIAFFYVADEFIRLFKKDDIAHDGHLIGAICGFIFGYIIFIV